MEHLMVEEESYPDHCEEDTDGSENCIDGCGVRDLLREIESFDGHIQRGESTVPPLLLLGLGIHGAKSA